MDVVACPGTDTCKLGIASSRGLAGEIRTRLAERLFTLDESVRNLHIKISGCFNSCGQHHIADLGLLRHEPDDRQSQGSALPGRARRQVAGQRRRLRSGDRHSAFKEYSGRHRKHHRPLCSANARAPKRFQDFIKRIGKQECRAMIEPFMARSVIRE